LLLFLDLGFRFWKEIGCWVFGTGSWAKKSVQSVIQTKISFQWTVVRIKTNSQFSEKIKKELSLFG
jgi:hypothetical protein